MDYLRLARLLLHLGFSCLLLPVALMASLWLSLAALADWVGSRPIYSGLLKVYPHALTSRQLFLPISVCHRSPADLVTTICSGGRSSGVRGGIEFGSSQASKHEPSGR